MILDNRSVTVSSVAKALAFSIKTHADKLALDLCGPNTTPHGRADADKQIAAMKVLLIELGFEL